MIYMAKKFPVALFVFIDILIKLLIDASYEPGFKTVCRKFKRIKGFKKVNQPFPNRKRTQIEYYKFFSGRRGLNSRFEKITGSERVHYNFLFWKPLLKKAIF